MVLQSQQKNTLRQPKTEILKSFRDVFKSQEAERFFCEYAGAPLPHLLMALKKKHNEALAIPSQPERLRPFHSKKTFRITYGMPRLGTTDAAIYA